MPMILKSRPVTGGHFERQAARGRPFAWDDVSPKIASRLNADFGDRSRCRRVIRIDREFVTRDACDVTYPAIDLLAVSPFPIRTTICGAERLITMMLTTIDRLLR
ncbi:hypothetical protein M2171_000745 [Bradyrhizobium japonicum USDA 38]|uniref:hypothetical protein n=1 Tax=Bradyrhizobium japonicum TaxID=375 RepID=UPI0012BB9B2E|nr:hypothetical protein [Bradyrhizobium japonicum]MCS3891612.1 hypothetical protein [Bradyrhizobium japonicum USDA 38]MCS3944128.1 hypothetical protein [Bradyrhizobium japonicum]